jgi:16S rRNA G966 N2-methylase RsmD
MSEKPEPMLSHFFRMTVDEYSRVLDPTAGSANAIRVAASRGASSVLGLEKDPEFFQRARDTFYD